MYNGYGAATQNAPSSYSMRDANGNLTMVNGVPTSAQYSASSQSGYAGGVGTAGADTQSQAMAIGNSLNVTVVGSHNTTIIDSSQINNGNQTATSTLNSH
jgi:holdfast attachment protein HfaA